MSTRASLLVSVVSAVTSLVLGVLATTACSTAPDARAVVTPPDGASFPIVAEYLVHRCGSLDCHGSRYRNLRLYGREGLRSSASDRPYVTPTTMDEVEQDYQSVVALEPEIMNAVVADHGAHPERLTLVRKARGTESHKGGALVREGDAQDVCLTSWLAGAADTAKCNDALAIP